MECEFCAGKPLLHELHIKKREEQNNNDNERIGNFIDIGRINLNRKGHYQNDKH
jgi:hypothetical protein